MMPAYVVAHLIAVGKLDDDGVTRRARPTQCRSCAAVVITGLDHDRVAVSVTVDPMPLSAAGELEALLTKRATFTVRRDGRGSLEINPRDLSQMKARSAGAIAGADCVAEHRCTSFPLSGTDSRISAAQAAVQEVSCPPF